MGLIRRLTAVLLGALSLHVLWVICAFVLSSPVLPQPWEVYEHIPEIVSEGLSIHLLKSIWRVLQGMAYSLLLAFPLALLLFKMNSAGKVLESVIYMSYPIPKLALLPIVMLFAGLGESTKVIMIVLIILFQLVIGLRDSLRQIPQDSIAVMTSLGASFGQNIRHIYLPAILPDVFSSFRIALGTAISVLFVTETYGTTYGMGYYIVDAWMRINYLDMYAGIILLSVIGFLFFILIDLIEYLACPWRPVALG